MSDSDHVNLLEPFQTEDIPRHIGLATNCLWTHDALVELLSVAWLRQHDKDVVSDIALLVKKFAVERECLSISPRCTYDTNLVGHVTWETQGRFALLQWTVEAVFPDQRDMYMFFPDHRFGTDGPYDTPGPRACTFKVRFTNLLSLLQSLSSLFRLVSVFVISLCIVCRLLSIYWKTEARTFILRKMMIQTEFSAQDHARRILRKVSCVVSIAD